MNLLIDKNMIPLIDMPTLNYTTTTVQKYRQEFCIHCTSVELFEENKINTIDLSQIFQARRFKEGLNKYYKSKGNITWFEVGDDSLISDYEMFVKLPIKQTRKMKVKIKSILKFTPKISI